MPFTHTAVLSMLCHGTTIHTHFDLPSSDMTVIWHLGWKTNISRVQFRWQACTCAPCTCQNLYNRQARTVYVSDILIWLTASRTARTTGYSSKLTARNSLSLISTSPGPWTVNSAPARALTAFARQCTLLVWPRRTHTRTHRLLTVVTLTQC